MSWIEDNIDLGAGGGSESGTVASNTGRQSTDTQPVKPSVAPRETGKCRSTRPARPSKRKTSPTQRSLAKLRAEGWLVAVVEHWNPHARIRQDLFGFIDLLAVKDNLEMGVQTTTKSNMAARRAKILAEQRFKVWDSSRYRLTCIHGWHKVGNKWQCKEEWL